MMGYYCSSGELRRSWFLSANDRQNLLLKHTLLELGGSKLADLSMINLPTIKIVRTTPPISLGFDSVVGNRLTVKPVAPGVWEEFLALQISPATRRSYAAGLRDFFRREFQVQVSPETILAFLQLPEREAMVMLLPIGDICSKLSYQRGL
jgi:hypothetical protein